MERMTRAAAARELGLDKSTLTRWVQKHPALVDDDGLVDITELRAHRDAVVNPKLQTRGKAAAAQSTAKPTAKGPETGIASTMNDHRARGEHAKAITAELDLADRLKMTLVRQDVEAQIATAGEVLKRKAAEIAKERAEALARIEDPRAMERELDEMMRRLLEQGATALILALSSADDSADDDTSQEDLRDDAA